MTISSMPDLLSSYQPVPGVYDEMLAADGVLREHWAHAARVIDGLGLAELLERRAKTRRLLDDDGVTYNVHGTGDALTTSTRTSATAWSLDPVPVLLASDEWAGIELGVIQRAELLNLVLTDLYGPRELLRRGLLPAELILGHPGFLRQCDQIRVPGTQQLIMTAVDLARDSTGRCTVLADHTQAPSGAGYALENRVVDLARVPQPLPRFAGAPARTVLPHACAPRSKRLPHPMPTSRGSCCSVPDLGARPRSSTRILASYLGYPLVEGTDLTVRDGRVWLRSLGRLERVDVILRRTDAWFCDPLELRPDSELGVPGLVEAARVGGVSIVNPLGSGVLENPGLAPYLPRLAEQLLGEHLLLPSVPTWWCGDDDGRRHVLAHFDEMVIKPISRGLGPTSMFPRELSHEARDDLRRRVEAYPAGWVGQVAIDLASAPTLTPKGLEARRTILARVRGRPQRLLHARCPAA